MFLEKNTFNHVYIGKSSDFYITEFGHSVLAQNKSVGPRIRDSYIIHFIISGECIFGKEKLTSGQMFLTPPGVMHEFYANSGYEHYWISFFGQKCEDILSMFHFPLGQLSSFYVCDMKYCENVLRNAFENTEESHAMSALFTLFGLLDIKEKAKKTNYAKQAARFIERNYFRHIQISTIAKYIHISEKYLCKKFKEEFGISPQKYLLTMRMEKSKMLLESTDLLIKEVSNSVGYASQLTFSEVFSKYYGMSPSKLRENAKVLKQIIIF